MLQRFCFFSTLILSIMTTEHCFAESVKLVSPKEFKSSIVKKNTIILDVRTPKEYSDGHLQNSILINAYDPAFKEKISKLDKTKHFLVYCHSGGRSHFASDYMIKNGFSKVSDMKGGITGWKKNGLKTVK